MLQRYKAENKTTFINSFPKQQFFGENYEHENWMKKTSKFNHKSYSIETIKNLTAQHTMMDLFITIYDATMHLYFMTFNCGEIVIMPSIVWKVGGICGYTARF